MNLLIEFNTWWSNATKNLLDEFTEAHVNFMSMSTSCSRQPYVHVNLMFMSTSCSCQTVLQSKYLNKANLYYISYTYLCWGSYQPHVQCLCHPQVHVNVYFKVNNEIILIYVINYIHPFLILRFMSTIIYLWISIDTID